MTEAAAVAGAVVDTPAVAGADAPVANMGDLKKAIEERDKYKALAKEREAAAAELKKLKDAQMSDQERLAAQLNELKPKADKVDKYEAVIGALLESELATVPEDMRDIVPSTLAPEDRLDWLRQAKAKGLFSKPDSAPTPQPPKSSPLQQRPGGSGKVMKRSMFDGMDASSKSDFVLKGGTLID